MRITPLMIAEAVICLALLVGSTITFVGGAERRAVGRAWRMARHAMISEDPNQAIEPLQTVVKSMPNRADLRMLLASLLAAANREQEIEEQLKAVAEDETAMVPGDEVRARQLRALAQTGLGMIAARAAVKEKDQKARKDGFAAAAELFENALRTECPQGVEAALSGGAERKPGAKESGVSRQDHLVACGDALTGLGLVALWAEDYVTAQKRLEQAAHPKCLLGREVLPELYNGLGLAAAAAGDLNAAKAHFAEAKRYSTRKDWKDPDNNVRAVTRSMAGSGDMKIEERKKLLSELEGGLAKSGKRPADTLNLIGCGYYILGDIARASKYLAEAAATEPDNVQLQINLLAVRCDILKAARAEYEKMASELMSQPPPASGSSFWQSPVGTKGQTVRSDAKKEELFKSLGDRYHEAQVEFETSSTAVLAKAADAVGPDVTRELILVRLEMLPALAERLEAGKDTHAQGQALTTALSAQMAEALGKYPDDVRVLRLQAVRQIAAGDYVGGARTLQAALKVKPEQPDAAGYVQAFGDDPQILGFLPTPTPGATAERVLARTSKPLLGFVARVTTASVPVAPEGISAKLDDRDLPGLLWGTEFLAMPDAPLSDGAHVLNVGVEDAFGRRATGRYEFLVDDSPPEIYQAEPADGDTVKSVRPKMTIFYRDRYSGIDPASVEVEVRSERGGTMLGLLDNPVRGGRHAHDYPEYGIKKGELVGADKVVLCPTRDLGAGPYRITVSVGDERGLKTTKTWVFTVAK